MRTIYKRDKNGKLTRDLRIIGSQAILEAFDLLWEDYLAKQREQEKLLNRKKKRRRYNRP